MVKERYVRNMQQARTSIVRQLHSLKLLVSGLDIDKSHFTPKLTETVFGRWFYGEAMLFSSENSLHCLGDIEQTLLEFHAHFTQIYATYYLKRAGGLLGLLGIKRKPTPAEKASAQHLYDEMIPLADRLRKQMNLLAAILETMPNEAFYQLSSIPEKRLVTA
ncbi:MAG: hypothetical protein MUP09_01750 [Thiovulaceae bacterium]|nr:hypothetical protein [Sulfurimonadaceae bacterium]